MGRMGSRRVWLPKGRHDEKKQSDQVRGPVFSSRTADKRAEGTSASRVVKGVIDLSGPVKSRKGSEPAVSNLRTKEKCLLENPADDSACRSEALGRFLSKLLRHDGVERGLDIREDGYCRVGAILKLNMATRAGVDLRRHTVNDVREVVKHDAKNRFSTMEENGQLYIRANQGHSIKTVNSARLLKEVSSADEVPVCVHGTFKCNLSSILKTGLRTMERNHVHFATGLPKDENVVSGMRSFSEVLIYLDVQKALTDGMKLYISDNGVVLTEGFEGVVLPKYFSKVILWPSQKPVKLV